VPLSEKHCVIEKRYLPEAVEPSSPSGRIPSYDRLMSKLYLLTDYLVISPLL
jgi:hypothetical protein